MSTLDNLPGSRTQHEIPAHKFRAGSLKGKKAIKIDDRTTAYVEKSKGKKYCNEVKERYLHQISKVK